MISWRTSGLPEPIWVEKLDKHSGMPEVVAGKLNPVIVDMLAGTRFPMDKVTTKTAWCAAAIEAALRAAGYRGTRSAAAASYATYGIEVAPQYGAIAVFDPASKDAGGTGHVTFIVGIDHDSFLCLGGNQSNTVRRSWYPKSRLVACRYPTQADALAKR